MGSGDALGAALVLTGMWLVSILSRAAWPRSRLVVGPLAGRPRRRDTSAHEAESLTAAMSCTSLPWSWYSSVIRRSTDNTVRPIDATRTSEPPSGADPDRPPYESGAAAVRGGEGFRGWTRTSDGRGQGPAGVTDAPPGTGTGGEIRTLIRPGLSRPGISSSRHARVPLRGLEPLHARLRVWCPASRAQAA